MKNFFDNIKKKIVVLIALMLVLAISIFFTVTNRQKNLDKLSQDEGKGKIKITATTTMLTDLAKEIGGDEVEVTGLMGAGIDPHLYQASAGDINILQKADIALYNGIHLEGKMGDIFESLKNQNKLVISAEDALDKSDLIESVDSAGNYDPHIWFDVSLWKKTAVHLSAQLSEYAPEKANVFEANLQAYLLKLDELDEYIKNQIGTLPKDKRILVTAHDAFSYFGKAYGFEVKGLQGLSTESEAGTQDIIELANYITEKEIKAIFVESSVSPKTIEALQASVKSKGFETEIGGLLYSDSLGDKENGTEDYIGTFKANIDIIVSALK